ncbi:hypothetical protein CRI70_16405 [Streptomyces sp. Ru87]|nr:hypothetical protein CRI70_16405 [Streptomyces sp. Ru87]
MTSARTPRGHRQADGSAAARRIRRMPRLLRGGAAGIAGVLLTATPTWGVGLDAAYRNPHLPDGDGARERTVRQARAETVERHQEGRSGTPREEQLSVLEALEISADVGAWTSSARAVPEGARTAARQGTPGGWAHPVAASDVSAAYGIPGSWIAGHHTGVDFAVPVGTPVRSIGPGEVIQAGPAGDYGLTVTVRLEDGHHVLFAHLSKIVVRQGSKVGPNELLGYSGNTGRSSGPHLHFEVRKGPGYGSDIDPVPYLAGKGVEL